MKVPAEIFDQLYVLKDKFHREVLLLSDDVDPDDQYDWDSLAFGWALANNASVEVAGYLSIAWHSNRNLEPEEKEVAK